MIELLGATPFRILLVEDIDLDRATLVRQLKRSFPDAQITPVGCVQDALQAIHLAAEKDFEPFDLAILDFKLPWQVGGHDEVDERVCQAFTTTSPRGVIIHISAYPEDEVIRKHMNCVHPSTPGSPTVHLVDRTLINSTKNLLETIRPLLQIHRRERIKFNLEALFGSLNDRSRLGGVGLFPRQTGRPISRLLAAFQIDVEQHWDSLDRALRQRVENYFVVREDEKGVHLFFLPRELRDDDQKDLEKTPNHEGENWRAQSDDANETT